jgi:hypothetical protein
MWSLSIVNAAGHQGDGMITFLLIVHGLCAIVLLGSITHQAMSAAWPSRNKSGLIGSFRAVSGAVYTNTNIALYLVTAILGGTIYPVYRVGVRTYLESARLYPAVGSFEIKEQFISVGLGLLPLYWLVWRRPMQADAMGTGAKTARIAVTLMLCFIVWYALLVGHVLNNMKGLFGL